MIKLDPNKDIWSKSIPVWERGQEGGRTRPINKDILFANVSEVVDCLKKFDIKYWISHGTMLGFYRDGDFITWDDDADISLDMKDRNKIELVIKELSAKGYHIPPLGDKTKPITFENPPYYDTNFIKNGEKVECWWFEREKLKDGREVYIYDKNRECLTHDAKYYDTLDAIKVRGKWFNSPSHIEDWLVMMYGHDWKVPQQDRKYNQTK